MAVELIVKKYRELYTFAIVIGLFLLIGLFYINSWDLFSLISTDYMVFLFSMSSVTMKLLSGIGIMLTYASLCRFAFRVLSDGMKGNPTFARRTKLALLVPVAVIAVYGASKIVGVAFSGGDTILDLLITIYGIWSFMLSIYVVPVIQGRYQPEYKRSRKDEIKKRFGDAKFSLWSGYQTRLRKDYGKVYAKEFERYGERMDYLRAQLSGVMLFPLGIALIVLPPIVLPLIVLWLRTFTLHKKPLTLFERIFLATMAIGIMILSTLIIVILDVAVTQILLDTVYGLGILTSIIALGYIVISS
ncbi:MAG: hypothetical protein EAX95_13840 [Candidatus Thorarchaeota archaeon]|nr:hypothetical protein [Candidatus Thorarchaeota archaeon]